MRPDGLKKAFSLLLLVTYLVTTPLLSVLHVHALPGCQQSAAYASGEPQSAKLHGTFCEICYRVTTASTIVEAFETPAGILPVIACAAPDLPGSLQAAELPSLPARAPPGLPRA